MIKAILFILFLLFLLTMAIIIIYRESRKILFQRITIVNNKGELENIWAYPINQKLYKDEQQRFYIKIYVYNEELNNVLEQKLYLNQLRNWNLK